MTATPQLHPKPGALRHSPIAGVILTNGEIDAVAGLLSMREGSPFAIYAHAKVLAILKSNSIFNVLSEKNVQPRSDRDRSTVRARPARRLASGLEIEAFTVPGKGAWYLEGKAHPGGSDGAGDTLGLRIRERASGKYFYFIAACAHVTPELKARLSGAPLVFFDGTVWRDDEMIAAGLGAKTGQSMGHIAMSGDRRRDRGAQGPRHRQEDISAYQQLQSGAARLLRGAQARRKRRLANPRRWNGDRAVNVVPTDMTAYSVGKRVPLNSAAELEAALRHIGATRYHILHPFHKLLHGGKLNKGQVQAWALNRYYYQSTIPLKDAVVISRFRERDTRMEWRHRIEDHDGDVGSRRRHRALAEADRRPRPRHRLCGIDRGHPPRDPLRGGSLCAFRPRQARRWRRSPPR